LYGPRDTKHGHRPTFVHDHSVTILRDREIVTSLPLERITGIKHDNTIESHFLDILDKYVEDEDNVIFAVANSFVGSTFISENGNLRIEPNGEVSVTEELIPAIVHWFPNGLDRREAEGYIVSHEIAHISCALAFLGEFPEESLLVHIDGGASFSANSFWCYENGQISLIDSGWGELHHLICNFNVNPLVRAILSHNSWQHLSIPGKLMGYASFGTPSEEIIRWLSDNDWFKWMDDKSETDIEKVLSMISNEFHPLEIFDEKEQILMDICASIQFAFENAVVDKISQISDNIGAKHLIYTGGGALNILVNSSVETNCKFESIFIPPCTNDSGMSLGAATWVDYKMNGNPRTVISPFLVRTSNEKSPTMDDIDEVIEMLLQGDVIGVCNGAGEIGPRALGHRSIIARMDSIEIRKHVSESIKNREWYRPLAPMMCEEAAKEALPLAVDSSLAKYMLGSWTVPEEWRTAFAGVIHIDGSVRAQVVSVSDDDNVWIHELLSRLWYNHGIPGLINTSFNQMGEPILFDNTLAQSAGEKLKLQGVVIDGSLHRC
jgi:carbamoyltransferase